MKTWKVIVECKVLREVICECSMEQVEEELWPFVSEQKELELIGWNVRSIRESKP